MTTENFFLKRFDHENITFCEGRYTQYREHLVPLFDIFEKHGHSGSSASFLSGLIKRWIDNLNFTEGGERLVIEIDPNFKDLFDYLENNFISTGFEPEYIYKLLDLMSRSFAQEPLEAISENRPEDWNQIDGEGDSFQHRRCSSLFSNNGFVYSLEGVRMLELYEDALGWSSYMTGSLPRREVTFPFDPFTYETVYYAFEREQADRTKWIKSGTKTEIKDWLEEYRKKARINWLMGMDHEGREMRPEIKFPMSWRALSTTIHHFNEHIAPAIDAGMDMLSLSYRERAMFEPSGFSMIPTRAIVVLNRMAYQYQCLDPDQRRTLNGTAFIPRMLYKPGEHYNSLVPVNHGTSLNPQLVTKAIDLAVEQKQAQYEQERQALRQTLAPALLSMKAETCEAVACNELVIEKDVRPWYEPLVVDEYNAPIENPRQYLYETCKEKGLEFKPGKHKPIWKELGEPMVDTQSAWLVDVVLRDKDGNCGYRNVFQPIDHQRLSVLKDALS